MEAFGKTQHARRKPSGLGVSPLVLVSRRRISLVIFLVRSIVAVARRWIRRQAGVRDAGVVANEGRWRGAHVTILAEAGRCDGPGLQRVAHLLLRLRDAGPNSRAVPGV